MLTTPTLDLSALRPLEPYLKALWGHVLTCPAAPYSVEVAPECVYSPIIAADRLSLVTCETLEVKHG